MTFSRFYAVHTLLLPAATVFLIALHVYLVRRHGITPGPSDNGNRDHFYPEQLFRDFTAVFLVFLSLFLAAAFLDLPLERMADPTDTTYVPRPEWYFLFLFQLLKLFPGRLELVGTMILPSIAILTLLLLPFLHRLQKAVLTEIASSLRYASCNFALVWIDGGGRFQRTSCEARQVRSPRARGVGSNSTGADAGLGYFCSLQCGSCHNLLVGDPKPGPNLGVTALRHPNEWMVQHFKEKAGVLLRTFRLLPIRQRRC